MLRRPLNHIPRSFAGIALPTKKLQVDGIVGAAANDRDDVIDFQLRRFPTGGAQAALFDAQGEDIAGCVKAAVFGFMGAALLLIDRTICSRILNVCGFPRRECGANVIPIPRIVHPRQAVKR